jgi:hypothetical protein
MGSDVNQRAVINFLGRRRGHPYHALMKKNRFAFLLLAGLAACASAPMPGNVQYRGTDVTDDATGLIVQGDEKKSLIVVTSYRDHYALLLPYSTEWKFTVERGRRLRGTGGRFNVTLTIEASDLSPDAQMKYVRTWVSSDKNPLPPDRTELMSVNGETVLRTEINAERVDKAFKGTKHINYYSAKNWKGTLYTLHISEVVPPEDAKKYSENRMRNYVTKGWSVDFMRK